MKNLTFILIAVGLILPPTVYAAGNRGSTDRTQSQRQKQHEEAAEVSEGGQITAPQTLVRGTVIVVDPNAESITVADYITGSNRTFLAPKMDLVNIRPGDRVNLTLQSGNSSRAQKVGKDSTPRP